MNEHLYRTRQPLTTQAAEGMPRRVWTVDEIKKIVGAGIILEDERFELIGGEAVPMSSKGIRHEVLKSELQRYWFPTLPEEISLITETTLYITDRDYLGPDFLFWPRSIPLADVSTGNALLIVEVGDTSVSYDIGRKALLYSQFGLREYWAIDAVRLVTRIHRDPGPQGYGSTTQHEAGERLLPLLAPSLAVTLADLGIGA